MSNSDNHAAAPSELEAIENREWLESLDYVLESAGPERAAQLLERLEAYAAKKGVQIPFTFNTPYVNTIPVSAQPDFPVYLDL